ncbi:MAG: cache domain-containing protein, partial [Rhodospirillales bacterium]|nr:cache domain-containing protein [Rhodospirillales bacterium]
MLLEKFKIGTRLLLIVASTVIGIAAVGGYALYEIRLNLLEDRQAKVQAIVEASQNIIKGYQEQVAKGEMTKETALTAARETIRNLRYDGDEYVFIFEPDGTNVLHPAKPSLEGTNMIGVQDPNGSYFMREMIDLAQSSGSGFVGYQWPKAGSEQPVD